MSYRNQWEADVFYEVWRRGGDPYAVDFDEIRSRDYYVGSECEDVAAAEVRRQRGH